MELKEALAQAQAKQATLRQRHESVAAELARLDGEIEETDADVTVLSRLVARYERVTPPPSGQIAAAVSLQDDAALWRSLPRMIAVERVLLNATGAVNPPEVLEVLRSHGRDDAPKHVHAALSHLKERERAMQPERGLWMHTSKVNGHAVEVAEGVL